MKKENDVKNVLLISILLGFFLASIYARFKFEVWFVKHYSRSVK